MSGRAPEADCEIFVSESSDKDTEKQQVLILIVGQQAAPVPADDNVIKWL